MPADLLVCALDGRILRLSDSAVLTLGLPSAESAVGRLITDLVARPDRRKVAAHIQALVDHGAPGPDRFTARRHDGTTFPAEARMNILLGPDGKATGFMLVLRDDTERQNTQKALQESEGLQRHLMENLPMGVFIVDPASRVLELVNNQAAVWFGAAKEKILGRRCHAFVCPAAERACPVCDLGRKVDNSERALLRADGSTMPILKSVKQIRIGGNEKLLECFLDITERKRAEEALGESAQRLQLATLSGKLGVWDRDLVSEKVIWDDKMYELYGLSGEKFEPSYQYWLHQLVHPEDRLAVEETLRAALAGERPYYVEFRTQLPDGKIRYMMSNAMVLRDGAGQAIRLIGINRDRTEQEEAERERRRLQAELHQAEKMESVGGLAGGVAHDMNNVLAAILASAEQLRQSFPDGDPAAGPLDHILHAGGRGRDLVQALTAFARKGVEETCTIDLNEILNREVELLRHTTLQRVKVVMALEPTLPKISGNASALGSAIMNLAINALDAMPAGGTLTFSSRILEDGMVGVEVADTGQGMAPEVLAKAVEPYFTTKPLGKGTGLGLSRVYGTVKAHGGLLELRSILGQGTSAVLHFPSVVPGKDGSAAIPGSGDVRVASTPAMDILLVDDDYLILETVAPLIISLGHKVRTAASGEEALSVLAAGPDPALVILDHHMPGLTGFETLARLRQGHPHLPVVVTTGFLEPATRDLLAGIPEVRVLMKPYRLDALKEVLAESLHDRFRQAWVNARDDESLLP